LINPLVSGTAAKEVFFTVKQVCLTGPLFMH
jgi:hypothetical protein